MTRKEKSVLMKSELFSGLGEREVEKFVSGRGCFVSKYERGEYVMRAGEVPKTFGIVLSGELTAYRPDRDGRENVFSTIGVGGHFADILVSAGNEESPVSLFVEENETEILNISLDGILAAEPETSAVILKNFLGVISAKYWGLFRKIEYMSVLPLKKRICDYLYDVSVSAKSESFYLPFDREGLAAYLNADRSALCRVLSELGRDGIIEYRKRCFKITDLAKLREIINRVR